MENSLLDGLYLTASMIKLWTCLQSTTDHGEGDRNAPIVQLEYLEMLQEISKLGSDKRRRDYRELYNTREARYRSMLVLLVGKSVFNSW
jgi:hypothetical protein